MRDAITLFEEELARHSGQTIMLDSPGLVGMMERDLESLYDLLLSTPESMDFEFDSEGSCPLLRECNMLHPLKDGAASKGRRG
jgi:hypothetical protein